MKLLTYLICIFMALVITHADAATKHKSKKKKTKSVSVVSPYVVAIGYPTIETAFKAIKMRIDVKIKTNAKPFGWQQRSGPWFVVNENSKLEWAFTEPGHYAHPSVIKRMIDIGAKDHVDVDMAFKCASPSKENCEQLLNEFKEVNLFIRKVYQKKYIITADGRPAWFGVDSLD